MAEPEVTVVVVPREPFSFAARSLASIYEHSDVPFRLVYVDGGSPSRVRHHLKDQKRKRGFKLRLENAGKSALLYDAYNTTERLGDRKRLLPPSGFLDDQGERGRGTDHCARH